MDERQEKDAAGQNQYGNPELNIGEYRAHYGRPGRLPFVHQFPHFLWARPFSQWEGLGTHGTLPIT